MLFRIAVSPWVPSCLANGMLRGMGPKPRTNAVGGAGCAACRRLSPSCNARWLSCVPRKLARSCRLLLRASAWAGRAPAPLIEHEGYRAHAGQTVTRQIRVLDSLQLQYVAVAVVVVAVMPAPKWWLCK